MKRSFWKKDKKPPKQEGGRDIDIVDWTNVCTLWEFDPLCTNLLIFINFTSSFHELNLHICRILYIFVKTN